VAVKKPFMWEGWKQGLPTIKKKTSDVVLVEMIVAALKKKLVWREWVTVDLRDPRESKDRNTPLDEYVREEVRHSIERMRQIQATKFLSGLHILRWDPPERADKLKWGCAVEARFLMTVYFSEQKPTGTAGGPFLTIAALLYEGVTGEKSTDVSMKRACEAVLLLRARKRDLNPRIVSVVRAY
jgi:hypothetical protein